MSAQQEFFRVPMAVAVDDEIRKAIAEGAIFVFSLSGGKDSAASTKEAMLYLDQMGHPRHLRFAIHADLGRAEWQSTPAMVEATAAMLGLELIIVRRGAGDMVQRWEKRFENGKARYQDLLTYNLIGPWSSAMLRFCTGEMKAQVIGPALVRRFRGKKIVQVIGIRRDESTGRKTTPISKPDPRFAKAGNRDGTEMMIWCPAVDWSTAQVFDCHDRHSLPLHEAYTTYGSTRLSCAFCVLASIHDHRAAAKATGNVDLYRHLVGMEAMSTFSFQGERWLGDVAPAILTPGLLRDLETGKRLASERRNIEAAMPAGLRYVKGWPVRVPDEVEAAAIVQARRSILDHHGLEDRYPTARAVIDRFQHLMDARPAAKR